MESIRQTLVGRMTGVKRIFSAKALTTNWQTCDAVGIDGASKGCLLVSYQRGQGEIDPNLQVRIEFSHDGTNWFIQAEGTTTHTASVHTVSPGTAQSVALAVGFDVTPAKYIRVAVKETSPEILHGTTTIDIVWMP